MRLRQLWGFVLVCLLWAVPAAGETEYYAVFMDGKKIGHATHARTVAAGKVTTTDELQMTISRMGRPLTIRQSETAVETTEGKPLSFEAVQDLSLVAMKIRGTVDDQGKVQVTVTSGAGTQRRELTWPEEAVMSEGMRLLAVKKGLKEGTSYAAKLFTGTLLSAVETTVEVGPKREVDLLGRVVKLTEVRGTAMGVTETSYVDSEHKALKTTLPILGSMVEVISCPKQVALSKGEAFDALTKLTLPSPAALEQLERVRSVSYHLLPVGKEAISIPATDSQAVAKGEDGTVIVTVRRPAAPAGAKLPYKGGDEALREDLKPTRFLQSDDEKVVALARQAIGETQDAAEAARRIESFVRKYIKKKDFSIGYATAAEVVENRQGDCSEHAVLAAAMCRAVGIPSRVAVGIAYVDRLGEQSHIFGGHAWTQANVGGKWIDLDAAMNGFNPGHIALAVGNGNPENFYQMLASLGYFKITKVEVEK